MQIIINGQFPWRKFPRLLICRPDISAAFLRNAWVGSQAISYTTGVPAMCGALMMLTGKWIRPGVYTVEEFDPDPYMDALNKYGLPWVVDENPVLVD